MDLRAQRAAPTERIDDTATQSLSSSSSSSFARETKDERRVRVGAAVAAEARAAVLAETGVRCSAGVAANKMIAKLVSGVHKPLVGRQPPPTRQGTDAAGQTTLAQRSGGGLGAGTAGARIGASAALSASR